MCLKLDVTGIYHILFITLMALKSQKGPSRVQQRLLKKGINKKSATLAYNLSTVYVLEQLGTYDPRATMS
jgi:hypothetical protein